MGTRSLIGKVNEDGTVTAVYCHWDGYISHNGHILRDHYDTQDKVDQLIALGGLSTLDEELDKVVSYHLWRDEPIVHIELENKQTYLEAKSYNDCCAEYLYLFENGEWFCSRRELGNDEDEEYSDNEVLDWYCLSKKEALLQQKERTLKVLADIEQELNKLN